jgi:hypothetical protein
VCQVANRNTSSRPNDAWPGFTGSGANLSRENTCFNADFFAAHLYAGHTAENPGGDVQALSPGSWTTTLYGSVQSRDWQARFFNGQSVPY